MDNGTMRSLCKFLHDVRSGSWNNNRTSECAAFDTTIHENTSGGEGNRGGEFGSQRDRRYRRRHSVCPGHGRGPESEGRPAEIQVLESLQDGGQRAGGRAASAGGAGADGGTVASILSRPVLWPC